jgi:hypothetical protein
LGRVGTRDALSRIVPSARVDVTGRRSEQSNWAAAPMKPLVVAILGITWLAVLGPPLVRGWLRDRHAASVSHREPTSFRRDLRTRQRGTPGPRRENSLYAPTGPRRPGSPVTPRPASGDTYRKPAAHVHLTSRTDAPSNHRGQHGDSPGPLRADERRRRNVLGGLVMAVLSTALVGVGTGVPALIGLNLLVDASLILYLYLLVRRRRTIERRALRNYWSRAA